MVNSMTGFAALQGGNGTTRWSWEIRSVNARGLDIRLRLPDGMDGLEQTVRKAIAARVNRGNVSLNLRLQREAVNGPLKLDAAQLARAVEALKMAETEADNQGLILTASSATHLLGIRGVLEPGSEEAGDQTALLADLVRDVPALIDDFAKTRASEGDATANILKGQLKTVTDLVTAADKAAAARLNTVGDNLRKNLARVMENAEGVDEDRLAQELALLAVKADVTEELDRLGAHIKAAEELLKTKGPVGRKFDFLMQEFNREANTLCSKSGSTDLTRIGLDLKTVIDQMREQVQNVE